MQTNLIFGTTNDSRRATKYGFIIGLLFTIIAISKFSIGYYSVGLIHFSKYIALFAGIYLASKKLLNPDTEDIMAFGLKISVRTAVFTILFSSLVYVFFGQAVLADSSAPVDTLEKFAINAFATFWGSLIFGSLSAYIAARMLGKH